jgi:hypothetical protein
MVPGHDAGSDYNKNSRVREGQARRAPGCFRSLHGSLSTNPLICCAPGCAACSGSATRRLNTGCFSVHQRRQLDSHPRRYEFCTCTLADACRGRPSSQISFPPAFPIPTERTQAVRQSVPVTEGVAFAFAPPHSRSQRRQIQVMCDRDQARLRSVARTVASVVSCYAEPTPPRVVECPRR